MDFGKSMPRQRSVKALFLMLVFSVGLTGPCSGQARAQVGPGEPVALVGGQPIYEQNLMSAAGPNLLDLRKQEYKLKSDALNQAIRKRLLELEAERKGLSYDDLLKQEVDSRIAEPSDDEAKAYYLALRNDTSLPFEQVKSLAKQLLKTAEIQRAREEYADSLRDKTEVSILLQPPVVQVTDDPSRVRGNPDAPVTIVEFGDFQCPFCNRIEPVLKDVLAKYQGKVKLSYRDFPLSPIHPNAKIAAEASHCALEQGKFWEMHDAMFADQSKLDEAALIKTAAGLGIDWKSFESCVKSGKYEQAVQQDIQAGSEAGVNATPSFFINGEFLGGVHSDEDFAQIIDRQLSELERKTSTEASSR